MHSITKSIMDLGNHDSLWQIQTKAKPWKAVPKIFSPAVCHLKLFLLRHCLHHPSAAFTWKGSFLSPTHNHFTASAHGRNFLPLESLSFVFWTHVAFIIWCSLQNELKPIAYVSGAFCWKKKKNFFFWEKGILKLKWELQKLSTYSLSMKSHRLPTIKYHFLLAIKC